MPNYIHEIGFQSILDGDGNTVILPGSFALALHFFPISSRVFVHLFSKRALALKFNPIGMKKTGVGGIVKLELAFDFNDLIFSRTYKHKISMSSFFIKTSRVLGILSS